MGGGGGEGRGGGLLERGEGLINIFFRRAAYLRGGLNRENTVLGNKST